MNKSYRSLWNAALSSWVAVPETARTQSSGKARTRTCLGALRRTVLAFAVASAWAMPAPAATLYWDINGVTPGLGGAGTWNTTNNFWNTSATGTGGSPSIWNNVTLNDAVFDGTGTMAVTLGTPITVHNLSFGALSSYTLGGSTLTLAGSAPTINTLGGTHTIGATLAGNAGLIKTGAGTLVLAGPNTYAGATRITGGTLAVSGSLNGTAISFGGAAAGTQLNATSLNSLTGTTSLSVNSANATAVLSAANNHTGATNLSSGILRLADGGALANSALTIDGDGTTLQLRSDTNTAFATAGGSISGFGNHGSRNYTIDADQLTSAGAGRTLTLGNLSILPGQSPTINFTGGHGYTIATGNITSPGAFNLTLNASGVNVNIGSVTLTTSPLPFQDLTLRSSSATGMNTIGAINGNFRVNGDGNGTWQLTAPSSFTGSLLVGRTGANTIQFSDVSQLGTGIGTNFIAIQNGSTLRYTGTSSQSTTARDLGWNSGAAIIDVTSASANLTFDITGGLRNNQITKAGAGQATLRKSTAINEITGAPVLITGGILEYNQNNAGAINRFAGAVTGSAGTQIKVSGTGYIGNDNLTADWSANRASLDVGSGAAFDLRGNKVTVDALTGGGTVRNSFLNSLTESGVVGYTLSVGVNGGSGTFGGVIRGSLTNTGEHAADAGGPNAIINLAKIGSGTQTFTGVNTYAGTTTVNAGTLQLGNGGTTGNLGSGAVTVAGGATLSFNRSNSYTVGNTISGGGTLAQIGTGTTVLTGTNTYSGATTVSAGSLYVNGEQTGATGLTSVANGATLGGTGILGGSVAIGDGILAPGTSPGTLTINGNLLLTGASRLNYEFGQASTIGGAFNDLTVVGGNLTLDGTLNVATSAGGTFGPGLYRVISYGGTLTDNGLALGTQPAGSTTFVQTAVANQVNLVNTAGLALNFWDGPIVPRNNGVVNGGNGTWQASAGNDNWTEATGAINAPYANGAFAIFSAAPGTVTVDNSLGAVVSGGMQFASSGYVVQGGPITLAAGSNTLRVGDGTAPGAGYVATIVSELAGSGGIDKTDLGTLVLTGANSYTGGTTTSAGTLQLGNAGTTGSIVGNVTNNGTLAFNRSDDATFGGVISGTGAVAKLGANTLTLTGANTYTGATTVAAGTLRAGAANTLSAASAHTVATGATLDTSGLNQRVAALTNSGTVSLVSAAAGSTLTTNGVYVGNAGLLRLGTALAGSASVSDRLVLDGAAARASGNTTIQIANLGGLGALTTGNGIEVVSGRNGATTTAQTTKSAFSLAGGHVDAGAFEYRLYAADLLGGGENWYLRSTAPPILPIPPIEPTPPLQSEQPAQPQPVPPVQVPTYRAEVPLLAALPAQQRQSDLAMLSNLHRRMGDEAPAATAGESSSGPDSQAPDASTRRAWARMVYADLGMEQSGIAQAQTDGHVSGVQAGSDLLVKGNWRAGVYVGYLDGNADVAGNAHGLTARVGSNKLQSRYLGAYATWMDADGWYVDSVLQGGSQRYDVRPDINPQVSDKASSFTASVETGKAFALDERWSIEPQAQLAWQHSRYDDLILSGARVHQDPGDGWIARLGLRVKGDFVTGAGRLQPYGRVNLYHASIGDDVATFIGPAGVTAMASGSSYSAGEVAAGATLALTPATSLYGELGHLWSIGGDATVKTSVQASIGVKVRW